MDRENNILPVAIAFLAAIIIMGTLKWLLPPNILPFDWGKSQKQLSVAEIPLVEQDKKDNGRTPMALGEIQREEKITPAKLVWKKGPSDTMRPYFIVKEESKKLLNNLVNFANAVKKTISNIFARVSLTMNMLVDRNPKKRETENDAVLNSIVQMNEFQASEALAASRIQRETNDLSALISSMNAVEKSSSADALIQSQKLRESKERDLSTIIKSMSSIDESARPRSKSAKGKTESKYEIVSGKVVGKEEEITKMVVIHR